MNAPAELPVPKTVVILGVPFHDVTMAETLAHIDAMIAARTPRYLATANLDFAAQASIDVELQRILLEAHLVLCDGTPLVWAARWLGAPLRERVAGSDLMPVLTAHCAARGHRMYLLGATDETLALASAKMRATHPDLIIAGTYAPPIAKLLDFDHEEILRRLAEARPDVLIVCFGCPKQEKWIYMNLARLGVPVSIGLGATLDFVAGNFKRAPVWMRRTGLEWVFRLLQEPRRLFNRYLFDLLFFVRALRRQRAVLAANPAPLSAPPPAPAPPPSDSAPAETTPVLVWQGRADAARVQAGDLATPADPAAFPSTYLDLSGVTYIDSTALGLLLRLYREAKARQADFALIRPSPAVTKLLTAMKLDRLLPSADSVDSARVRAGIGLKARGQQDRDLVLTFDGDLVAAACDHLRTWIQTAWTDAPQARQLVLNLQRVRFMDSSGLGLLVAMHRLAAQRPGARLRLRKVNSNLRNVIRLARLEAFFDLPAETEEGGEA